MILTVIINSKIQMKQLYWKDVDSKKHGNSPTCRWGHSSCVVKDTLYMFGGFASNFYFKSRFKLSQ